MRRFWFALWALFISFDRNPAVEKFLDQLVEELKRAGRRDVGWWFYEGDGMSFHEYPHYYLWERRGWRKHDILHIYSAYGTVEVRYSENPTLARRAKQELGLATAR